MTENNGKSDQDN